MSSSLHRKLNHGLSLLVVGILIFVAGLSLSHGMNTQTHGALSPCVFMLEHGNTCPMSIVDHVSLWQAMFTFAAAPAFEIMLSVVMLIFASLTMIIRLCSHHKRRLLSQARWLLRRISAIRKVFSPYSQAFSDGILHPKIFSLFIA